MTKKLKSWYFTFGHGHDLFPGHVQIDAKDFGTAREQMFKAYGRKWCFHYDKPPKAPGDCNQVDYIEVNE